MLEILAQSLRLASRLPAHRPYDLSPHNPGWGACWGDWRPPVHDTALPRLRAIPPRD